MHNKANNPIISDEFLEQVVKEINAQFGGPINEKMIVSNMGAMMKEIELNPPSLI